MAFILSALLAYLLGSIPTSYLAGRLVAGIDLRSHGSGNLGAANTFRILGAKPALVVLLVDVAKGFLPVHLAPLLPGADQVPGHWLKLVAAFFAVVGHMFSVFVSLSGGKGIATTAGAYLALSPYAFLLALALWLLVLAASRIVSMASLSAALALPFIVVGTWRLGWSQARWSELAVSIALTFVIVVKHRSNIQRLIAGQEPKLGRKKQLI